MDPRAGLLRGDAVQNIGECIVLEAGTQCQMILTAQGGIRHDPADQRQEFPVLGGKIRGLLYHEYIAEQGIVHDDATQQVVKGLILTAVYLRALLIGKAAAAPDIPDMLDKVRRTEALLHTFQPQAVLQADRDRICQELSAHVDDHKGTFRFFRNVAEHIGNILAAQKGLQQRNIKSLRLTGFHEDIPDALQDRTRFASFNLCPVHKGIFTHRRLPASRPDQIQPVFRKPGKCGLVTGIRIGKIKDILHRGFWLRVRTGQLLHMKDICVFRDMGIRHRIIFRQPAQKF